MVHKINVNVACGCIPRRYGSMDYEYYKNEYGGSKVDEVDFNLLNLDAKMEVNYWTLGRSNKVLSGELSVDDDVVNLVKLTICQLMDKKAELSEHGGGHIKSESVGEYSVTFNDSNEAGVSDATYSIIRRNLSHTGLMYRGVYHVHK